MLSQRWFGAKSREIAHVQVVAAPVVADRGAAARARASSRSGSTRARTSSTSFPSVSGASGGTGSPRWRAGSPTTRSPTPSSRASSSSPCGGRQTLPAARRWSSSVQRARRPARCERFRPHGSRAVEHVARLRRRPRPQGLPAHRGRCEPGARAAAVPDRPRLPVRSRRSRAGAAYLGTPLEATLGDRAGVRRRAKATAGSWRWRRCARATATGSSSGCGCSAR